jgi:hypothetical protein
MTASLVHATNPATQPNDTRECQSCLVAHVAVVELVLVGRQLWFLADKGELAPL